MISCRHGLLDDRIYKKEGITLQNNGYEVIHIGYADKGKKYTTKDGIQIIQIERIKRNNSLKSLIKSFKQSWMNDIFEEAKNLKAEIYHLQDVELCRLAIKLKKLAHRPKVIYDAHEPYPENLKDYSRFASKSKILFRDIPAVCAEKKILKKVDLLIATEENVGARFLKNNPNSVIIHNYSFFNPENEFHSEKEYDLIYCGGLSEIKGIDLIIESIVSAKKRGIFTSAVFVGRYTTLTLEEKINRIIEENNIQDLVTFTGEISIEEIEFYYRKSKIGLCIFPVDRSNQLILPIKLFEYMSFGLPLIGSNFGHIKKIIEENDAGITVDPYNQEEIIAAISTLLNENQYENYFKRNTNAVNNKYLWKHEEPKLLAAYKRLEI